MLPVKEEIRLQEEVTHFVTTSTSYHAVTITGRVLNIVRSRSLQPPITSEKGFTTFLWVEALEGFFLFSQQVVDQIPAGWILEKEIVPADPQGFFLSYLDELKETLQAS